ncbi:MAG: glycosyltransferase [Candidatus Zixiibacteriota bacterium]|nr:MAG: glycosyltransferase [candidate division Zixibacteria bacterium]
MEHLFFILPPEPYHPTGGNWYNQFLLKHLRERGVLFQTLTLGGGLESLARGRRGQYFVDSLLLDHLAELLDRAGAGQDIFVIVHHMHSLYPSQYQDIRMALLEQELYGRVTGFLVTSSFTGSVLQEWRHRQQPVFEVRPALCCLPTESEFQPVTGFRGLMVANLTPVKGVLELLQGLALRLSDRERFDLRIVGRPDLDPHYTRRCLQVVEGHAALKASVRLLGSLSLAQLQEAYTGSNLFLSASQIETYGMAVHEARAFGLPVLALNTGNLRNLVQPGRTGQLFGALPDLVEDVIQLIRKPQAIQALHRRAFEHRLKDDYSWEDAADLFLAQLRVWRSHRPAHREDSRTVLAVE